MNQNALAPLAGLLCPLLFIVFIVAAIILAFRRAKAARNASGSSGPPLAKIPTQLADDGFWLGSCPVDSGSLVLFQYWSAGAQYSGKVPFQPAADGRQFVYTGRRPERVAIVRVVEVDADDFSSTLIPPIVAASSTWDPPDMSPTTSDPSSSSPSFPSAY